MEKWKQAISQIENNRQKAKKDLKRDAFLRENDHFLSQVNELTRALDTEKQKRLQELDSELETFKKAIPKTKRNVTSEDIAKSNFMMKTVRSKIAAEAHDARTFLSIVEELANSEDASDRQLLIDHYHDFLELGNKLFEKVNGERLKTAYRTAKESFKTPEEKKFDEESNQLIMKKISVENGFNALQRRLDSLRSDIQWDKMNSQNHTFLS